ncbi:MAG: response regulator transcription factor [Anaerolineae bacterium]|nr:response regulator transcription factor [Thermoflexales bacterium]MCX7939635.1 response regulator transcription factor [Thermoflexales bacterium]MDW8054335.1 response regulator transcription factor [Anaerolineae bacterium]
MIAQASARVLIADDQQKVRSALRLLIDQELAFCVVGEASNAEMLQQIADQATPHIVLLDWELPGLPPNGKRLALVRNIVPSAWVIAMSGHPEARQQALEEGADSFVSKSDPPEAMLRALYSAYEKLHDARRLAVQPHRTV